VLSGILIGVAALVLVVYRQLVARPVNSTGLRVAGILGILGLIEAAQFLRTNHSGPATYAALGGSLVLAAVFGAIRASTVRIWIKDGRAWSQGNWLTAALWVVALAAHLGYDDLVAPGHGDKSVGASTALLYLAVSLGIQRVVVQQRARRLEPGVPAGGISQLDGLG
jgi:hypothetical protein